MITRRAFSSLLGAAPAAYVKAAAQKKNVLFIAIDDMNDWVGCMGGHPGTITPNLDKLAGSGVMFHSAHCAAPLCNPSRTAIMTGRRPSSTGVYDNSQPYHGSKALAGVPTLNQHFKDNGYLTLGCGKIYHGTYGAYSDKAGWHDYGQPKSDFRLGGTKPLAGPAGQAHFDWGATVGGDEEMNDYHVVDWVNGHLAKKRDQPMFLACGIFRPHLPWYVPQKYYDMHPLESIQLPVVKEDDLDDVPAMGKRFAKAQGDHARVTKAGAWKKAVQAYLACISFSDAMVGRVLRGLETSPYANDTAVVLWSDHGWHLGEKLHWRKFTLWERSTRNLLMMKVPGVTRAGGVCPRPVSMIDIYPTLMELTGVAAPAGLEGQTLVPWLKSPKAPKKDPVVTTYGFKNHAVRSEQWRYIRYSDGGEELYDRVKDPDEWTNLASKPELAKTREELARWLPKHDEADAPRVKGGGEAD
jgi:arylsulfatase A-like enzyme